MQQVISWETTLWMMSVCVCVCVCENKICTFRKRGICEQHLVQDTKHTKKWRDRGRGLGCVTICVNKYLCKVRKSGPTVHGISTDAESLRSQRLRDKQTNSGVDNPGTDRSAGIDNHISELGKLWGATSDV